MVWVQRWFGGVALLAFFSFALEHGLPSAQAHTHTQPASQSGSSTSPSPVVAPSQTPPTARRSLITQTQEEADAKSAGCVSCHVNVDEPTMHPTRTVRLGCTDCHGGEPGARIAPGTAKDSANYTQVKWKAHVQPRDPVFTHGLANAQRVYTAWLRESYGYVRFANPGDLRVARETCGSVGCHTSEVRNVSTSMM